MNLAPSGTPDRLSDTSGTGRTERQKNPEVSPRHTTMKTPIEYIIVAVPFHADAATHDELAKKVNEKLGSGYELFGPPFLSEEMMYQSMTKPRHTTDASPIP